MAAYLYRGREDNPMRREILAALSEQQPLVRDVLFDYVQAATGKSSHAVGVTIGFMLKKGEIMETTDGYRLANHNGANGETHHEANVAPRSAMPPRRTAQSNPETETGDIAPYFKDRKAQAITVESSPVEFEDVIHLSLKMGEGRNTRYMPIPLFTSVRVVYGELVRIHPSQEVYRGASAIRVLTHDGRVHEYQIDPEKDVVLVAPR